MSMDGQEFQFDFEKLHVYQNALEFIDLIFGMCKKMGNEYKSSIADQLQRAGVSISTNIAEGCGKLSRREKIRYFSYALDSAKECIPPLTIAHRQGQIREEDAHAARDKCTGICKMLGKLIRTVEDQELKRGM